MSRTREASGASTPSIPNTTSVQVAVRIRPVTTADQSNIPPRWQKSILTASSNSSVTVEPGSAPPAGPGGSAGPSSALTRDKRQAFSFDRVFSPADGQKDIFTVAEPLIDRFIEGYNVTILAYGQTSSGKSYTMGTSAGDDVDYEGLVAGRSADPQMGIIPRAVARIFSAMRNNKSNGTQYSAKVSFIEIYNEDLIDLLGDAVDGDARPHVQIREGKNGQIIWSGLREAKVANVAEVMNFLLQGSSVRRTNETDMNAQSSRSHAIFSITLTQKKWVGSGPPPNAAPPSSFGGRATPGGRAVSSLSRASGIPMAGRVASPSFGRRTPSGIPALGGRTSSIGLRPPSTYGDVGDDSIGSASADGEWVTVSSKFHFVDLAGSERLKRTAAQGDRVKEGISINSGLHALGNVISALGDPAKAKRATHIPYRDSKLTRLLQDSLGGNAHTLMIACVSPTEYNVSETVNTLQYANRARNIKNKAELNEVEVGWDDVDYLQTLVQRLRKELSIIKGVGKGIVDLDDPRNKNATRTTQREVLAWQDKYASLSQKHSQLTAEVTQLRTQLDPSKQDGSEQDFFRAAEPIIVEYEKSIDALEGQLNLTKAALAYVEDIANEREAQIEQQSSQLEIIGAELEEKEADVAELQSRLKKLQERESSSEVYARELEARLEAVGSRGDTDSAVLAELHKEIARLKEVETSSEQYIRDLEAKLASSDESAASLARKVAQMEADLEKRDEDYRNLLSRFELLDNGQETRAMAAELEAKTGEVNTLEARLAEASAKHDSLASRFDSLTAQHDQLAKVSDGHEQEKHSLSQKIKELQVAAAAGVAAGGVGGALLGAAAKSHDDDDDDAAAKALPSNGVDASAVEELEERLTSLQEEMRAVRDSESSIRAELELTRQKYKELLAEINDLNSQLTEIKLNGGVPSHLEPDSFKLDKDAGGDDEQLEVLDSQGDENQPPQTPGRGSNLQQRSLSSRRPGSLLIDTTNRQTPSPSNRLSRRSSGSFLGYNKSDGTRSSAISPLAHGRTRSISQSSSLDFASALPSQLSQTRGPRPLSLTGSVPPSPTLKAFEHDSPANYERKVASLEKETMRLQEALKDRDEEIQALETSLRSRRQSTVASLATSPTKAELGVSGDEVEQTLLAPAHAGVNGADTGALTPATAKDLEAIRQVMAQGAAGSSSTDSNSTQMLDDLMRSMARKETQHRETVESMSAELSALRKQNETLETLSRDQVANMSLEIEELRAQLAAKSTQIVPQEADLAKARSPSGRSLADELDAAAAAEQDAAADAAQAEVQRLKQEHAAAIDRLEQQHKVGMEQLAQQHAESLAKMQPSASTRSVPGGFGADEDEEDHAEVLAKAQQDHAQELTKVKEEAHVALTKALDAQTAQHQSVVAEHEAKLASINADVAQSLRTNEEQLQALRDSHSKALQEARMELEAQHLSAVSVATREAEAATVAKHTAALEKIQQEHATTVSQMTEQLTALKTEHQSTLDKMQAEHASKLDRSLLDLQIVNSDRDEARRAYEELHAKHQDVLAKLEIDPHEVDTLRAELNDTSDALVTLEAALTEVQEERDQLLIEIEMMRQESEAAQQQQQQQQDTSVTSTGSNARNAATPSPADAALKRELESHKSMLSKTRGDMTKLKAELQAARDECARHEQLVKDLQLRLATSETRSMRSNGSGSFGQHSQSEHDAAIAAAAATAGASLTNGARSPINSRRASDYESPNNTLDLRNHRPSLGAAKPPPPTPPPNMPPPPTPAGGTLTGRTSAGVRTSTSSLMTRPESPANVGASSMTRSSSMTSVHSPAGHMLGNGAGPDVKLTRLLSEQAEEIKNLARQLNHCEADLQANIDLVATLEAALNDSERNLRKSRVQLSEVTRERERYAAEANAMRAQLNTAQSEVENVRNSVMLEKQGFESKLEEERLAKERARKALEARLEEVSKRKGNKLFCL
ncbi:related to KIP1-kinesin-related protein [Sporisorium reilianum SRZ2]|uniref:Related to KIP1-kinesin-related protein n=1 Tax=Sporisorium reilianum (strain SRZ2) TaxID=999809 RepID=E7A252_SPORE|nr:related to KIP1-kinesin-related protein [Sporisorium reilianum SRZ2]